MNQDLIHIAENLLLSVKKNEDTATLRDQLEKADFWQLIHLDDNSKKAFWINIYNAWYQLLEQNQISRYNIFRGRYIPIAGKHLSLDEIEHGILRRRKWKLSFGYLRWPFYSKTVSMLALRKDDFRIHFALNCGQASCPPIAFYHAENINKELDDATISYLEDETKVDHDKRVISVNQLLFWYIGDFGGKKGIMKILNDYKIIEEQSEQNGFKIRFHAFNKQELPANFKV